jgi:hypothetical protein
MRSLLFVCIGLLIGNGLLWVMDEVKVRRGYIEHSGKIYRVIPAEVR